MRLGMICGTRPWPSSAAMPLGTSSGRSCLGLMTVHVTPLHWGVPADKEKQRQKVGSHDNLLDFCVSSLQGWRASHTLLRAELQEAGSFVLQ